MSRPTEVADDLSQQRAKQQQERLRKALKQKVAVLGRAGKFAGAAGLDALTSGQRLEDASSIEGAVVALFQALPDVVALPTDTVAELFNCDGFDISARIDQEKESVKALSLAKAKEEEAKALEKARATTEADESKSRFDQLLQASNDLPEFAGKVTIMVQRPMPQQVAVAMAA